MTIQLKVVDREGVEHSLKVAAQGVLMEVLRDAELGVAAICGGSLSCGTCHVYVDPDQLSLIPQPKADERDLVTELQHCRENSRLSCQVPLSDALDGLRVTVAPEE